MPAITLAGRETEILREGHSCLRALARITDEPPAAPADMAAPLPEL